MKFFKIKVENTVTTTEYYETEAETEEAAKQRAHYFADNPGVFARRVGPRHTQRVITLTECLEKELEFKGRKG